MFERSNGHFVVVSSVVGYVGTPERSAYAASKHALHGYFESLRAEAHTRGVKVTMVCPGFVATELRRSALTESGVARGENAEINPRAMSSEACANAIVRAIETEAPEIHIGGREIAAIYLRRFAPPLLARLLLKVKST
jgi:short-subunit dehydrogenase